MSNNPNPLRYGWVALIAYVLMIAGIFCLVISRSAGFDLGFTKIAGLSVIYLGIFDLRFGPALAVWLGGVLMLFRMGKIPRGRTWLAVLPSLVFLLYQVSALCVLPPSPQKYFEKNFRAKLPSDANSIEVEHSTITDPGYVEFAFVSSESSTLALVEEMNLKEINMESGMPAVSLRVGRDWKVHEWGSASQFLKVERSGTGYLLICDSNKQRVVVIRDPLFAKSETDNPNGDFSDE